MKFERRDEIERARRADYPLMESRGGELATGSGRTLAEVHAEAARSGDLSGADLQIDAATLSKQADIAADAGFPQLAENLRRAAELTRVPNEELLEMYQALRPGRSSADELASLAQRLDEQFDAPLCAAFVREAAEVYQSRNLLRRRW